MSLDKTCPVFIKEKEIREIMCKEGWTYRKSLTYFLQERGKNKTVDKGISEINTQRASQPTPYRDALLRTTTVQEAQNTSSVESNEENVCG